MVYSVFQPERKMSDLKTPSAAAIRAAGENPSPKMLSRAVEIAIAEGFRPPAPGTDITPSMMLFHGTDPRRVSSPRMFMARVLVEMIERAEKVLANKDRMILEECVKIAQSEGLKVDGFKITRYNSLGQQIRSGSVRTFYHRALINVDNWILKMELDFQGAVCPKHPALLGKRQFTTYRCVGCQRSSTDKYTIDADRWAREKVTKEAADAGVTFEHIPNIDDVIEELSIAAGWQLTPDDMWYDPESGKKHSKNALHNDAQAVVKQTRVNVEQRHRMLMTGLTQQETHDIINNLMCDINEEQGLSFDINERCWYDPETNETFPRTHNMEKARALLKQRYLAFGTYKAPTRD
jgi:hypothetical protein